MSPRAVAAEDVAWGPKGLVPAVVQDVADGRVLMVAYMDAQALAVTLASGDVHFHSRSRNRLWRKGETSGNVLHLVDLSLDCDADALLLAVRPVGPACHRGTRSCFDGAAEIRTPLPSSEATVAAAQVSHGAPRTQGFAWLEMLWATIDSRSDADPGVSYTARLLATGVDGTARKVAEEAVEVLIAAKDDATAGPDRRPGVRDALIGEAADLLYHTLVLLRERGLQPAEVIDRLRQRHRP